MDSEDGAVAAAVSVGRLAALGQLRRQCWSLPHLVHLPSATHLLISACRASTRCLAARSIGAEPRWGVAPVESAGLFEWGIRLRGPLFADWPPDWPLPPGGLHLAAKRRIWSSSLFTLATYSASVSSAGGRFCYTLQGYHTAKGTGKAIC